MKGIGVSPGISIGRAFVIKKRSAVLTGVLLKDEAAVAADIEKYDAAVKVSIAAIEALIENGSSSLGQESLEILETQIEFLGDPRIRSNVIEKITTEKKNVRDSLIEVIGETVLLFLAMPDEYMRARASDIRDIGDRILGHLSGAGQDGPQTGKTGASGQTDWSFGQDGQPSGKLDPFDMQTDFVGGLSGSFDGEAGLRGPFEPGTILIAEDLTPSDTITMDTTHIIGFATQAGSRTSHAAIVAKSRGIPAIVGCGKELSLIADKDLLILDSLNGLLFVNPDAEQLAAYEEKRADYVRQAGQLQTLAALPARTKDGVIINLLANIAEAADMGQVIDKGGEGVGLLRTELLFMGRDSFPTEEEQFGFYKKIALAAGDRPVTVRTLDIGGDKQLSYFGLPAEQNPFLGYRAIRICLDREELFITQLKAILRAGAFGKFKIMLPMIGNIRELRLAKAVLARAKSELLQEKKAFADNIPTGIMIEIPAAALTADLLAKEADFFSIGTNDLIQYTLAVDRMNEKVKDLYDPFDPGVLRLIRHTIEQGYKNNIPVSMCGEMASDPLATLLLLGMGLTAFSMSASSIPSIKNNIHNITLSKAKEVAKKVMEMDNSQDITAYLQEVNR